MGRRRFAAILINDLRRAGGPGLGDYGVRPSIAYLKTNK